MRFFTDDEYGRNGINSLDDELAERLSKVHKIALPASASEDKILDLLKKSIIIGPRVYVAHVNPDSGLKIFSIAQNLGMMSDEYVWLATDWLSTALETSKTVNFDLLSDLRGVVGFRPHIPNSKVRSAFISRWRDLQRKGGISAELNAYGFYAYDSVWAVAHAVDEFLNEFGNITFSSNNALSSAKGKMQLDKLRTFDGGNLLLKKLLLLNFSGLSGPVKFDSNKNLVGSTYEIININSAQIQTIGYWSNYTGLSISLPDTMHGNNKRDLRMSKRLGNTTWPSGKTETPRGWVVADSERPLRIGVPYRASYTEFVGVEKENHTVNGYCIEVFNAATRLIPYDVSHQFVPVGDGRSNPNYDELVRMVVEDVSTKFYHLSFGLCCFYDFLGVNYATGD